MIHEDCIFCKIANNKAPAYVLYEDSDFISFLDMHPQSPGHALVIPKDHYRWVWDVPNAGDYFKVAQKIAKALQKAFGQEMIMSKVVGEDIHHAHIWVYPSIDTKGFKDDFEGNKKIIVDALQQNKAAPIFRE